MIEITKIDDWNVLRLDTSDYEWRMELQPVEEEVYMCDKRVSFKQNEINYSSVTIKWRKL